MSDYTRLDVWKESMLLVKELYVLTKSFPKEEIYALTSQIRRAAVSVPSNIAEGIGRNYKKDTIQFLYIARGSLCEIETLLNVSVMIEITGEEDFKRVMQLINKSLQLLNGLIRYYEKASLK